METVLECELELALVEVWIEEVLETVDECALEDADVLPAEAVEVGGGAAPAVSP